MNKYHVKVELVSLATFEVEADSEDHARALIDCGMTEEDECIDLETLGSDIKEIKKV